MIFYYYNKVGIELANDQGKQIIEIWEGYFHMFDMFLWCQQITDSWEAWEWI